MRITPAVFPTAGCAIRAVGKELRTLGHKVEPLTWQGMKAPAPMLELLEVSFRSPIPPHIELMQEDIKPNLPWADEHFNERVSREPTNPGESWKNWPFYPKNERDRIIRKNEKFTHTYQERIWSKKAGDHRDNALENNVGVRYEYGDLDDVVNLLRRDTLTRQAFLPIWFPEDTGAVHGGRVPCSLGYLFLIRRGHLHCSYYIRSCDYFRHFRDDVYLAMRLALWVRDEVNTNLKMGYLNMYIGSLHCWYSERGVLPQ